MKKSKTGKVKFKSKSSLSKRIIKVSKNGGVKMAHASTSHLFFGKTAKRKRQLRGNTFLDITDYRRLKLMIKL